MRFDPALHHRRSIRLKEFDYTSPGAYFVTICTVDRAPLLGGIIEGQMRMSEYGTIAQEEWWRGEKIRPGIHLDAWVVMPNHVHGVVIIDTGPRGTARRAQAPEQFGQPVPTSLPTLMRAYKSAVTRRVNLLRQTPGAPVWQRDYYEHVVRDEDDLNRIREYILTNPQRWPFDHENPARVGGEEEFDW